MVIYSTDSRYALQPGRMMRIEGASGWRLCCEQGTVLVTQAGDSRDVELRAGVQVVIGTNGRVLVESPNPALITLHPPATWRQRLAQVFGAAPGPGSPENVA